MEQWKCIKPGLITKLKTDLPKPGIGYSLLRVISVGICGTDIHAFDGTQPFFNYPRILGHELALEIIESNKYPIGELATIIPYFNCTFCEACLKGKSNCCEKIEVFGVHIDGGLQEYICVEDRYIILGKGLNKTELVLVEPFSIAAHALRKANIQLGDSVLVMGAGPIGIFTIILAKIKGAKVRVKEQNPIRLSFCNSYLNVKEANNDELFQTVIDATGNRNAIESGFEKISHGGQFILIGLQKETISFSHPSFHKREATLMSSRNATLEDFYYVMDLFRNKKIECEKLVNLTLAKNHISTVFERIKAYKKLIIKAQISLEMK